MTQNSTKEVSATREQINAVIALLLVLVGKEGEKELLKKRRANRGAVRYFETIGLLSKDLAGIFNTGENSISNLKAKKKVKRQKKKK